MAEDATLVSLLTTCIRTNNAQLWDEFISKAQPIVAATVARTMPQWPPPSVHHADDIIQDVFLKLCDGNFRLLRQCRAENDQSLAAYLRRIAATVTLDSLRAQSAQRRGGGLVPTAMEDFDLIASADRDPGQQAQWNILTARIERCLASHASLERLVFWMYYRHGFTAAMISRLPQLGLSLKGVESTIHRLTKAVRACLSVPVARETVAG